MNLLAIYGAGMLIGAALIIIIPEGMLVLISALEKMKEEKQGLKYIIDAK